MMEWCLETSVCLTKRGRKSWFAFLESCFDSSGGIETTKTDFSQLCINCATWGSVGQTFCRRLCQKHWSAPAARHHSFVKVYPCGRCRAWESSGSAVLEMCRGIEGCIRWMFFTEAPAKSIESIGTSRLRRAAAVLDAFAGGPCSGGRWRHRRFHGCAVRGAAPAPATTRCASAFATGQKAGGALGRSNSCTSGARKPSGTRGGNPNLSHHGEWCSKSYATGAWAWCWHGIFLLCVFLLLQLSQSGE